MEFIARSREEAEEIADLEDAIMLAAFHGMDASDAVQRLTALLSKSPNPIPARRYEF